jgi:hypothetical protein
MALRERLARGSGRHNADRPVADLEPLGRRGIRPWLWVVVAVYLATLAVAVLAPQSPPLSLEPLTSRTWFGGLPLGWLADIARNLLLFLPLGVGAACWGLTGRQAIALGFGLSCAVELIQLVIPGRFGSPVDLIANTLGTASGVALMARRGAWLAPPATRASVLSIKACIASAALLLAGSLLLQPVFPPSTYYGGWTPELGHLARYQGRVLEASVGTAPIVPSGPAADSRALRSELASGAPWFVRAIAGPPPGSTAPLVTIHDQYRREILLLGIDGADLIIRQRTLATVAGLESPTMRLRGVLREMHPADIVTIRITAGESIGRVELNGDTPQPAAWTAGRSWALLVRLPSLTPIVERTLDALWIAVLVFPASYWARRTSICWLGVAGLLVLLVVLPWLGPVTSSPLSEWLGAVGGMLGARWCSQRAMLASVLASPEDSC